MVDVVKFNNIQYKFSHANIDSLSYQDIIKNDSNLTDILFVKNKIIALENSKILKIGLQDSSRESLRDEESFIFLSINPESKRVNVLTESNRINSLSFGNEITRESKLIDRKISINEKYVVSNMKSYKNDIFLSIRGYGVNKLYNTKINSYRTEDAQDVEFSQKKNVIAVADAFDGIVLFEPNENKPMSKIQLEDDICQEIKLFGQNLLIKGKNGLYHYNLDSKKLHPIWSRSVGAFTTYYDMIFFSSENKLHMMSISPTSIRNFKFKRDFDINLAKAF